MAFAANSLTGGLFAERGLLDPDGQQHLRMDMAAHRERPRPRKINLDRLARRLLRGVERHVSRIDIDLMEEFVLVGKQNSVAPSDRDRGCCEVAAFLDDSVDRGGAGKARDENKDEKNYDDDAAPYQFPRDHRKRPCRTSG
jgi:hypothetical protein